MATADCYDGYSRAPPHVAPNQAMASSSSSSLHGQQQQQQQSFQQQLRQQQPPPLSHGLNSSARGPSPPHPPHGGVPPHLPISGSSVSYSDDNNAGGGGGSSFGMLNMQASFDDSSSHLDLPSLLQANGNNGGRDVRLGVGLDHHQHHQHHYNHQQHQQHHHHHHQHSSWSSHAVDPLPPVARLPENKPQELPSPDGSPEVSQHSSTTSTSATKKRGAGDMGGVGHHQAAPSQQHFASAGDEAPKPARAKKKKVEKNSNALPLDDNDLLDDEFGDGLDCEVDGGGGGGGGKDVKRQMRLVKNRQAAQQFRKRQKLYIQDLERRCTTLTAQNASYAAKVELLSTENRLVKEQLEYLRSFVSQAVQVSLTPAAVAGGPLQMPGPLSAALAGAIPAPLLGIGSPLAGALSSHHPSQTGPGRPAFAPLQPHPTTGGNGGGGGGGGGSHLGAKMPSFPSPVSLAPASSSAPRSSAYGGGASSSAYARGASSSLTSDHHHHHHRPL